VKNYQTTNIMPENAKPKKRGRPKQAVKNDESKPNYTAMPPPITPGSLDVKIREKDIFEQMGGKKVKKK
jgi:hypothetical protein